MKKLISSVLMITIIITSTFNQCFADNLTNNFYNNGSNLYVRNDGIRSLIETFEIKKSDLEKLQKQFKPFSFNDILIKMSSIGISTSLIKPFINSMKQLDDLSKHLNKNNKYSKFSKFKMLLCKSSKSLVLFFLINLGIAFAINLTPYINSKISAKLMDTELIIKNLEACFERNEDVIVTKNFPYIFIQN